MRNYVKFTLIVVVVSLLWSCKRELIIAPPIDRNRTVLVYIVADNNLANNALKDIAEMSRGWNSALNGTLLVMHNDGKGQSKLLEINSSSSKVIKDYGTSNDPCEASFFAGVIDDAVKHAPAKSYGLIMWSHGSGWIPATFSEIQSSPPVQYSIGVTDTFNRALDIDAMVKALPANMIFDFIAFDACYMASIELMYQLRNHTRYILSSVAEILTAGFPYDQIVPLMMEPRANMEGMLDAIYNYYATLEGEARSVTISLADCSQLEGLAVQIRALIEANPLISTQIPRSSIQQFGRYQYRDIFYDLGSFIEQSYPQADLNKFHEALTKALPYKKATPSMFNSFQVRTHCGASCYIPRRGDDRTLTVFNTRFEWSLASGISLIQL